VRAIIGLGSNIDPTRNIRLAARLLGRCEGWNLIAMSATYRSPAVGTDGPDFLNSAVLVETELGRDEMRDRLRGIEARIGRVRSDDRFAPREIDLDIVAFEDGSYFDPDLAEFPHVAVPAADLAPNWEYEPGEVTFQQLVETLDREGLERMTSDIIPMGQSRHYAAEESMEATNGEVYDAEYEESVRGQLVALGEDVEREGLLRTPLRVAKAMDFLTSGYTTSVEEVVNNAIFEVESDEMVLVKDVEYYSLCEHHMLPFFGKAHIAYLPNKKIIGLSKIARILDVFARRLQVQERLANQVADALEEVLDPLGVAVVMEGSHFCMMMRGVQKQGSSMITSAMRGGFKNNPSTRAELMELIKG
jgi:GTP cyclohydrolase I